MNKNLTQLIAEKEKKISYKIGLHFPLEIDGLNEFIDKILPLVRAAMIETALTMERECQMNDVVVTAGTSKRTGQRYRD